MEKMPRDLDAPPHFADILEALGICRRRIVSASAYTAALDDNWQILLAARKTGLKSARASHCTMRSETRCGRGAERSLYDKG
jgi:hypothetical protein